ncbi:MAG: ComEC/Rec2 family competence protein [Propionibacteriaceae bacterium]|nr:ComEC/Rec2 family competence protein [Propionibacteriaceae bacterium]
MSQSESLADPRMVWVAVLVWAGAWCGVTGGWVWAAVAVVVVGTALLAWRRASLVVFLGAACILASAGSGALYKWTTTSSPLASFADAGAVVQIRAVVTGDPQVWAARGVLPGRTMVAVSVHQVSGHGVAYNLRQSAALLMGLDAPKLAVGQAITFDARSGWSDSGLSPQVRLSVLGDVTVTAQPGAVGRAINGLRDGLRAAMAHSPPDQAGLVPGLVVGDTSGLSSQMLDDFQATSLTHLNAVSGTNLTLMVVFLIAAARLAGARGWWLRGVTLCGVVAYVTLCRGEPSVLRAAAMGLVALAATGVGSGPGSGLRHWGVAVTAVCLIQPAMSHTWGFAMSAVATAAILWWSPTWVRIMTRWMPLWLAQAIAVPLAAQLATQPLITALSGQVSLVGLFANMVAEPFVGPVTVLGLLACVLSPLGWVAVPFAWMAGWCAQPIILAARFGASQPGATITWGTSQWGSAVLAMALLVATCWLISRLMSWVLARWWTTVLALAVLFVSVAVTLPTPGWPGRWSVVFCDVGQGDAAVVRVADGVGVLIDAGPDPPSLQRCLSSLGIKRLPLVVFSHEHSDHMAGAADLAKRVHVDLVLVRAGLSAADQRQVGVLLGDTTVPVAATWTGQVVDVGATSSGDALVRWVTLRTGPATPVVTTTGEGEDPLANNASTIGRITVDGLTVLFTGDAEPEEQGVVASSGADLRADVLKTPHHGSAHQDASFLAAVGARVAVISVGADNPYGHPASSTVTALLTDGMTVYRTDQMGAIAVSPDGVHAQHRRS